MFRVEDGALSSHQSGPSLAWGNSDDSAARLDCLPELVADNPKIGPFTDSPFSPRQMPGHFLPSARLSIEPLLPPDLFARDTLVPQKSTDGAELP